MAVQRPTFSESWYRVAELKPALRSTVQIFRRQFRSQQWHVLQDPGSNQYFRLNEPAYHFVAMLDGRRSVADAWDACNEVLGDDAPTQGEVIQLLGQLYASNLLQADLPPDTEGMLARYRKRMRREVQGYLMNLLFVRIPLFDPDAFLNRWVGLFGWVFSKWMAIPWFAVVLAGLYFVIGDFDRLTDRAAGVLAPDNLPLLYLSFLVVKLFHEFGHAFACKTFGRDSGGGGEVHTIGIMLLVFTPMPYVDASSSWTLRSKWQRAFVGAAGMYVELAVAAVAAIVWANTASGNVVHAIAYNVMFIASVSTLLFNANPLLRYDGYYILSDLLEIPNLSQRSKEHIYYLVKRYVWGVRHARSPAHSLGEKIWFPLYGVASMLYRVFICTAILLFVADAFLMLGLVLAIGAVATWVAVPLMKFFHYVLMSPELSRVRWRAILSTAIVLGGLAAGIGVLPAPQHVRAEGIVEADHDTLFTKEEGFVATVLPSGTSVTPDGEPILVCENPDLQSRLRELLAHRRELTVRRRMARQEEPAAAAILDERIAAADERIKRIRQRIADLRLHPNREGVWLTRHDETINGAYLQRGKPLGIVAAMDQLTIRATAGQDIAHRILGNVDHLAVEIRLRNRPDLQLTGRVERISPAGRQQLPSAALGFAAGGSMATDPDDPEGMQTTERFFEVHIQPDEQSTVPLLAGQRVLVRFTLPEKPLAVQWYQRLLQLIQQRFQI